MKQTILIGMLCVLLSSFGAADLYITEVMHSPTQVSDSDGEWVEIYNDGEQTVDLSTWSLDEKDIGNRTINAKEYFILARELLDSTDTDTESFESYWGNNNGLWDEWFPVQEVSMSLKTEDSIVLTNGIDTEIFSYNSSFGGEEGKTIERLSVFEWQEGAVDGTPGFGNFSTETTTPGNEIYLFIDILNSLPEIVSVSIFDEEEEDGVQVLPILGEEKTVLLQVLVNDSDGFENIQTVSFSALNLSGNFSFDKNISSTAAWYLGNMTLPTSLLAGEYEVTIEAADHEDTTNTKQSFEYMGIVSTELNVTSFSFSMHSGAIEERVVQLLNGGNTLIDTEISADDLVSETGIIPKSSIEIFEDVWLPLANPIFMDLNVAPQTKAELQFRVRTPEQTASGHYEGKITINSMESSND